MALQADIVNKLRLSAIASVYALTLAGCTAQNQADNTTGTEGSDRLAVVATHSVLCDMTRAIAQETIDLTCLIEPGVDPHVYRVTPEDRKAIETAGLILYGGYDFEPELIRIINATSNTAEKVAVHEVAVPKPIITADGHHHHDHDHAHGEAEAQSNSQQPAPDPHVWHDVQNGISMAQTIRDRLTKLAPTHFNTYAANTQQLTQELTEVDNWIKAQTSTIPANQRKLISTHEALNYYANAYGLSVEGVLQGLSTEEKPSAARVRQVVQEVRKSQVPTIFAEVTASDRVITTVAKEAGVKVAEQPLYVDTLGKPGSQADTYIGMLKSNTCTITEGLGGRCTPLETQTSQN